MKREIRTPKQKRSVEKKSRIVEAAYRLFNTKGYHNTNTAEIAAEAGLSTGCLYDYFLDKSDIFLEAVKMHSADTYQLVRGELLALPEGMALPDFMERLARIFLRAHSRSAGFHKEVMALSLTDPKLRSALSTPADPAVRETLGRYLERFGVCLTHPSEQVQLLINVLDDTSHNLLYKEMQGVDQEIYIQECARMLCRLLTE
jgi:AcrR family transcriptional regulator